MQAINLYQTRLTDIASATAPLSCKIPTAPRTFTSKTPLRLATSQTGCRHRRVISYSGCACICPAKPFSTMSIRCRRSSKYHDAAYGSSTYIRFGRDRGVGNGHASPCLNFVIKSQSRSVGNWKIRLIPSIFLLIVLGQSHRAATTTRLKSIWCSRFVSGAEC
jgi:hypothetical protein